MMGNDTSGRATEMAKKVEIFVRTVVVPYETDPRYDEHGPTDALVAELREKARSAGVLTPHILPDGVHMTQRETAAVLKKSGLSLLGPLALNTAAPDEGNMFLLGKVGSEEQKRRFLEPLVQATARSAFFMTEPSEEGGAGSDPSMLKTTAKLDGNHWVINGTKKFITGAVGAKVGIIMAKSESGACLFLVDLPHPAIQVTGALGHPLADFAYNAMMYRMPPNYVAGLAGADLQALNIPNEADYVAAYCKRTGRPEIRNYGFYIAFNFFRLAAIFHGIKGRVLRGTATSVQAKERVAILPDLIKLAWAQAVSAGAK